MEELVMPLRPQDWAGRKVFLTGHTGFKGGWLAIWLHSWGAQVTGYALAPPTTPHLYGQARVRESLANETIADVREASRLREALHTAAPEVVFHLAAQPLVRASYRDPLETFSTNVMGTANLLEAARSCGNVRAIVVVTTDKCYAERRGDQQGPHGEDDRLGGHDPYSASKACAELVSASYRDAFALAVHGVGLATARAGNVIGGGDWTPERLVPDLLQAMARGEPARLRRPDDVRPWQHVLEPLAGYLQLAQALLSDPGGFSRAWNFGPAADQAWTVRAVVDELLRLAEHAGMPAPAPLIERPAEVLHETAVLQLDASQARAKLAWQPRMNVGDALGLTLEWHANWQRGADMQEVTRAQISDYTEKLS